jgi:hypothetical protein
VDVAYQLGKVALPIADNGLVAILEEMAVPSMPTLAARERQGYACAMTKSLTSHSIELKRAQA